MVPAIILIPLFAVCTGIRMCHEVSKFIQKAGEGVASHVQRECEYDNELSRQQQS